MFYYVINRYYVTLFIYQSCVNDMMFVDLTFCIQCFIFQIPQRHYKVCMR